MRVFGVDFTSVPCDRKPIVVAVCEFESGLLRLTGLKPLPSLAAFRSFLEVISDSVQITGLDLPFSQPRRLFENLGYPLNWTQASRKIAGMNWHQFHSLLLEYQEFRPPGDRHHFRVTDEIAAAASPMNTVRPPVARMYHAALPFLLETTLSLEPCRPANNRSWAVEAYPALIVRRVIGRTCYKGSPYCDGEAVQSANRALVLEALRSPGIRKVFGFGVEIPEDFDQLIVDDVAGDRLDAICAAVQAAWAWTRRDEGFGIPEGADALEGWIVDPCFVSPAQATQPAPSRRLDRELTSH